MLSTYHVEYRLAGFQNYYGATVRATSEEEALRELKYQALELDADLIVDAKVTKEEPGITETTPQTDGGADPADLLHEVEDWRE